MGNNIADCHQHNSKNTVTAKQVLTLHCLETIKEYVDTSGWLFRFPIYVQA